MSVGKEPCEAALLTQRRLVGSESSGGEVARVGNGPTTGTARIARSSMSWELSVCIVTSQAAIPKGRSM